MKNDPPFCNPVCRPLSSISFWYFLIGIHQMGFRFFYLFQPVEKAVEAGFIPPAEEFLGIDILDGV